MSFIINNVTNHPRPLSGSKKVFICTSVDDIAKLPRYGIKGTQTGCADVHNKPCDYGSTAIVKTGEVYMLWPDNEWSPM